MNKFSATFAVLAALALCACGSSSDTQTAHEVTPQPVQTASAKFVDSPVEGLTVTSGQTVSTTDAQGAFTYEVGQPVTFSLGGIVLGTAPASSVMTPLSLDAQTLDVGSPRATNVLRLLQTLDADGNPGNGITLSQAVREAAKSLSLDVGSGITAFESDSKTQYALSVLTQLNGAPRGLVTSEEAQTHFRQTMSRMMSGEFRITIGQTGGGKLTMRQDQASSFTGQTPAGLTAVAVTVADDGSLAIGCSVGGGVQECMRLTVSHTDGAQAEGTYSEAGQTGSWSAERVSRIPNTPACSANPQLCQ